jgi:hypothetical protein
MASPAVKEKGLSIQTRISSIFEFFKSSCKKTQILYPTENPVAMAKRMTITIVRAG